MINRWLQIAVFLASILILGVSVVSAREGEEMAKEVSEKVVVVDAGAASPAGEMVHYYLPYPGILPDHFLYPVKMVRDRVAEILTLNEVAKIKLLELYADKRVGAAKVLLEGGQEELGVETGRKALRYQERAVSLMEKVKKQGIEEGELMNQLERATAKHAEVWGGLVDKVGEESKPRMNEYKDKTMELNKRMQRVLGRE